MSQSINENASNLVNAVSGEGYGDAILADYKLCYESTAAERAALDEGDVLDANLSIPHAVSIANGARARIEALRPQMISLPVNLKAIDSLGLYAGGAAYAQALFAVETAPPPAMEAAYERLLQARTFFRLDGVNLAARDIINEHALDGLNGEAGFHNVAYDVLSLVSIHEAASAKSAGRTTVTPAELLAARTEASNFLSQLAQREQMLKTRSELNDQRRRAVTLLINAYDEARRVVTFLLWKEPEKYLPSLYAARGAGRPKAGATTPTSDVPLPLTPAPVAVAADGGAAAGAVAPGAPVAGSRGGNPFAAGE
jgi:hypothetical protein